MAYSLILWKHLSWLIGLGFTSIGKNFDFVISALSLSALSYLLCVFQTFCLLYLELCVGDRR